MYTNVLRNACAFLSWTVTSFLCHYFAKTFMDNEQPKIEAVVIITACQLMFCYVSLHLKHNTTESHSGIGLIAVTGHVLATFCTNYSMSTLHASSTMAVKMLEPVTSAIVQRMVLSTEVQRTTILSLPVIAGGLVIFTGNPFKGGVIAKSLTMAVVSNLCLAIRNIAMKESFVDRQLIIKSFKWLVSIPLINILLSYALYNYGYKSQSFQIATVTVSSLCHVLYSYVSLVLVLKSVSVITHAILNICKRVLVVLLLCLFGTRVVTAMNLLGLLIASTGLVIYAYGKMTSSQKILEKASAKKIKRRLVIMITACLSYIIADTLITFSLYGDGFRVCLFLHKSSHVSRRAATTSGQPAAHTKLGQLRYDFDNVVDPLINFSSVRGPISGYPFETNKNMLQISTVSEVIKETQNIHFRLFNDLIGHYPYVILLDIPDNENKGDSAITNGELTLLYRLQKKIIFLCITRHCTNHNLTIAYNEALKYGKTKVAVLCQGNGNMISYPRHDTLWERIFKLFSGFKIVVFPQSLGMNNSSQLQLCCEMYSRYPNVTFLIRDVKSLTRARHHLSKNQFILAPDMAYQTGDVPRTIRPYYDILWLKRDDTKSSKYNNRDLVYENVTIKISDWIKWLPSNHAQNDIERTHIITLNGFLFLQRGRIVITDRLHGHIMATLLHIPHVLMDTSDNRLTSYHNTWTSALEGDTILTANSPQDAIDKAQVLLKRFKNKLPLVKSLSNSYIYP